MAAFHREVIEKKPEDFKIACLKDIQVRIVFAFLHHRSGKWDYIHTESLCKQQRAETKMNFFRADFVSQKSILRWIWK
jgi:hypothetical protein